MSADHSPAARRAVMLGLDAMVTLTASKFLAEGIMPNLSKLLDRGVLTRILPVIPAQTPSNWTTLATGATPGTHGVVQWGSHIPGEPVWEYHRPDAFTSGLCRAEYLWEAAARQGKQSVVFNYAGYPPTTNDATHIDWLFQPARSYFDLAEPTVYHNSPKHNTTDPVRLLPAGDWHAAPASSHPPLETLLRVEPATQGRGPVYYALVFAQGKDYDRVLIAADRDAAQPLAVLGVGEWSDWVYAFFEMADQGQSEGAFRFKLLSLSPDGQELMLYRSDAFPTDGRFCSKPELGQKLVRELGPYVHAGMTCGLHCKDRVDMDTVDELMADEAVWWSNAAEMAMQEAGADLLVLHWHILDAMGHAFVPMIDPTGTAYDPSLADYYWQIVRRYYQAADRFIGAFVDRFDDGETVFAIVSDHGMPANKKSVSLVNLFKDKGWITLTADGQDVDWPRSKLFWSQNHLWINLQGRDPGGVVLPQEYYALRSAVVTALRGLTDPETGEHVIAFALPREDAAMVGMWGDYIGDIVYCYEGGYTWSGPGVLRLGEERLVFPRTGGNHGPMICTYETDTTSVLGTLALSGPGIKAGVMLPKPDQVRICTTDLAPTLSHLLGLEPPAQNEGRVLHEFLTGVCSDYPRRAFKTMDRPIWQRPTVQPNPIRLQGDVTDEEA